MSDKSQVKFDPVKLEQLRIAQDYPLEPDEFELLFRENAYCEMAHVNGRGYPVVTPMFYVIKDDDALMRGIHCQIIDKYFFELTTDEEREAVFEAVHTPLRCIIEVVPEKILTWDLGKMLEAHDEGVWYGESQKLVEKHMDPKYL